MLAHRNNLLTAYFHPNNSSEIINRQRRTKVLTINCTNLQLHDSATKPILPQKIKHDFDRPSPLLIHRHRPSIAPLSPPQQWSDMIDISGNHLQLIQPPQSITRPKPSRISPLHVKPFSPSKTRNDTPTKYISKFPQSLQPPIWTPVFSDKEVRLPRSSRSKSFLVKHYPIHHHHHHPLHIEKKNSILDLTISSRSTNVKDSITEYEDPQSRIAVLPNKYDSILPNCHTPPLKTSNPPNNLDQFDLFASSTFIPNYYTPSKKRRFLRHPLPVVIEDITDEID